jgi:filamentous hemagglutinin family protein
LRNFRPRPLPFPSPFLSSVLLGLLASTSLYWSIASGQVTTNITGSGSGTAIEHADGSATWNIRGGTPSPGETNLFHSFGDLSVGNGHTAAFQNLQADGMTPVVTSASGVNNIIGRVTGGNPSNIFGTIDSQTGFPNANLFLINPAGIVFGPGAALNVGGSVNFSTADYLRMGIGNELFYADLGRSSTLSSAPVTAFGFLGTTAPRAIEVRGSNLTVGAGNTVTLVGGESGFTDTASGTTPGGVSLTNGAMVTAPGGSINLVSLGPTSTGVEVDVTPEPGGTTSLPTGLPSLGTVTASDGSTVSVSGSAANADGGAIVIQGGRLALAGNSSMVANGSGTGNAGSVSVQTATVVLTSDGPAAPSSVTAGGGSGGGSLDFSSATSFSAQHASLQADSIMIGASPAIGSAIDFSDTSLQGRSFNLSAETLAFTNTAVTADATNATSPGTLIVNSPNVTLIDSQITATALDSAWAVLDFQQASSFASTNGILTAQALGAGQWGSISIGHAGSQSLGLTNTTVEGGTLALTGAAISIVGGNTTAHATSGTTGTVTIHTNQFALADNAAISTVTSGTASGGNILIEGTGGIGTPASQVVLSDSSLATASSGSAKAGDITVISDSLGVNNGSITTSAAGTGSGGRLTITGNRGMTLTDHIFQTTVTGGTGTPTGDIELTSPILTVSGGSVTTRSLGTRQAGGITLNVDSLTMQPGTAGAATATGNPVITSLGMAGLNGGRAGNISIRGVGGQGTTPRILRLIGATILQRDNSGDIVSGELSGINLEASEIIELGPGTTLQADVEHVVAADCVAPCDPRNRGFIDITVPTLILDGGMIDAQARGTGRSGDITINVNALLLDNGAAITSKSGAVLQNCGPSCSGLRGGDGGNITIQGLDGTGTAAERVTIQSDSIITADTTNTGAGGNITINAAHLDLRSGGTISSSSTAIVPEPGPGGNVALNIGAQYVSSGGVISTTAIQGQSGNVLIHASDVRLVEGSIVTAQSDGPGDAGSIRIVSDNTILLKNSSIRTSAAMASGGNIVLNAPRMITLDDGQVTSSVNGPAGSNGGNISIDPDFVILKNGSQILAQAVGGNGGNINIVAGTFLAEPGTVIDASSQLGISGDISIQSPIQSLSGAIAPLPNNFSNLANLYAQHCAANKGGQFSSFVQGARDGVPPQPGDFLSSPLSWDRMTGSPATSDGSSRPTLMDVRLGFAPLSVSDSPSVSSRARCAS